MLRTDGLPRRFRSHADRFCTVTVLYGYWEFIPTARYSPPMGDTPLTVTLPMDLAITADVTVYGGTATVWLEGGVALRTSPSAAEIVDVWLETHPADPTVVLRIPTYPPGESIGVGRSGTARVRLSAITAVDLPWIKPDSDW